jgi:DNA-binding transcriptional LysR family regulator
LTKDRLSSLQRPPPQPDANALELFARIVAAGSFAQAARDLNLTRAAVSRRVATIEAQLGAPLFTRTTRALGLSEAGRRLAPRARAVLEATDAARRGLRARGADDAQGLSGSLRITSVPMFGQAVLGPLLARFQALHPALRIELRLTNRRIDLLREDIDVALRLTSRPPPDCVAVPVLRFVVRAWAAPVPGVPLSDPADLAHNRCLLFSPPTEGVTLTWQHEASGERRGVAIEPAMVGDELGTLQAAARAGGGIYFSPDFAVRDDVQRGLLVDALPGWQLPVPESNLVQALTLPMNVAPQSARELVRFMREELAQAPEGASSGRRGSGFAGPPAAPP